MILEYIFGLLLCEYGFTVVTTFDSVRISVYIISFQLWQIVSDKFGSSMPKTWQLCCVGHEILLHLYWLYVILTCKLSWFDNLCYHLSRAYLVVGALRCTCASYLVLYCTIQLEQCMQSYFHYLSWDYRIYPCACPSAVKHHQINSGGEVRHSGPSALTKMQQVTYHTFTYDDKIS
jgi:hypothetical protein